MYTIGEKLNPRRFTAMSNKMAAIVAYVLGDEAVHSTVPAIDELVQTSDGYILARNEGDIGANDFLGSSQDFNRNWRNLIAAAELTSDEAKHVRKLIKQAVSRP